MRYRSIDILRGLAASAVALAHVNPRFNVGAIGVDIFFVVSGFVMAHVSRQRTAGQFLADRAWRIFPVYWAVAVPWILLGLSAGALGLVQAANSLLLWPAWWSGLDSLFIGVSWTLTYELAFYLCVAAAICLRSPIFPLILFGLALLARPFTDNSLIAFAGHPIAVEFLFGVAIALAPKPQRIGGGALALGVIWLTLFPNAQFHDFLHNPRESHGILRLLLWGVPSALIVYGLVCQEERLGSSWTRFPLLLGAASYSIYLVHSLVVGLVDLAWPIEFVLSISTGLIVWRLVERPILDYRHRKRLAVRRDREAALLLQAETA